MFRFICVSTYRFRPDDVNGSLLFQMSSPTWPWPVVVRASLPPPAVAGVCRGLRRPGARHHSETHAADTGQRGGSASPDTAVWVDVRRRLHNGHRQTGRLVYVTHPDTAVWVDVRRRLHNGHRQTGRGWSTSLAQTQLSEWTSDAGFTTAIVRQVGWSTSLAQTQLSEWTSDAGFTTAIVRQVGWSTSLAQTQLSEWTSDAGFTTAIVRQVGAGLRHLPRHSCLSGRQTLASQRPSSDR